MAEAKALKPSLDMLYGKGIATNDAESSVGSIAYAGDHLEPKSEQEVLEAAKQFYVWLRKPQSKLRSLIHFLSGAGVFFVARCHEKSHRAYIEHAKAAMITEEEYCAMAVARLCPKKTGLVKSELGGLL